MKTNMLILAFVLCASAMTVLGQAPSQQPPPRDTTSVQPSESYLKGMTMIKSSEIPSSLRTTLQAPEYKGWENVPIYRNETKDMYIIEMRDTNQKLVPYRFDGNGKVIKDN
jgi:hypothetical protein